jgi:hypothetical protein
LLDDTVGIATDTAVNIAYFDCFSGISGDMALGALIDCGVPVEKLHAGLSSLPVSGWQIKAHPVLQSGIHAMDVTISLDGLTDADELQQSHEHGHSHHHSHPHHPTTRPTGTQPHHLHGRSMAEIREIIEASHLSDDVKKTSLDIFGHIAQAEAHLHHSTLEEIHFHEIGGIDSLIDICGTVWCLEYLGVDEVHCSPLPYSTGFVDCAHGRLPVPAPATLELLKGVAMTPTEVKGELVTPTGAGIVSTLSKGFGPMPAMTPRRIGFGSGKKRFADRPNLLRVVIGERTLSPSPAASMEAQAEAQLDGLEWKTLSVIESNIDDMNPEFFNHVFERLFAAGAVDVWLQPIQMKKNRPGFLLGVLCEPAVQGPVIAAMLRETTTLGVRVSTVQRAALPRESRSVETRYGTVGVKIAQWPQQNLWRAAPEYADVERLARENSVSPREVYQAAVISVEGEAGRAE